MAGLIAAPLLSSAAKILLGPVGAVVGLSLSVVLCVTATVQHFELSSARSQAAALTKSINDPTSGYVVKLAQADTNTKTLKVAIGQSNKALDDLSAADAARIAALTKQIAGAQATIQTDTGRLAIFDAHHDTGADVCTRAQDEDKSVQELLR
jgi:uncharacterized protein YfiM (DUF2279 family)